MSDKKTVKIAPARGRAMLIWVGKRPLDRLEQHAGIVEPKIDDRRAMVDCVMMDTAYNGTVFDCCRVGHPRAQDGFVDGQGEFPAPAPETLVAVKVIDMLGEEVLVTAEVRPGQALQ